jgi:arginyl-tRNA synthetase
MNEVKRQVLGALGKAAGGEATDEDVKVSPVADYGSPVAYKLARKLGKKPEDIAAEIAGRIRPAGFIASASAEGGYVNFNLDYGEVARYLLSKPEKPAKKKGKIVLEHTSVNPTGPIHVGRIRNTIIGDSLRRVLQQVGYEVKTHYYVNDIGKQIAIISAALSENIKPDDELKAKHIKYAGREDYETLFTYVQANKRFEEDVAFQGTVQSLIQAAEAGDKKALNQITSAAKRCLKGQMETFKRLNVCFDVFDYESDALKDGGLDEVLEKVRENPGYRKSELGEGLDLSRYNIEKRSGMTVLARADGTSVYLARDIAYHLKKLRLGERLINVLGEDHKLEFMELKTILAEIFGANKPIDVVHFSFVSFEGVKFSTRRGEIAAVDELLDEAVAKAKAEVDKRKLGDEDTPRIVGVGAVKFHLVKTTPNKQITFRWADALNFEGETAPYIQYAHARSCRILEKSGVDADGIKDVDYDIKDKAEKELILKLLDFDDVVNEAAEQLRPDLIATYLIELTGAYGRFYMNCPVLDSAGGVRNRRLLLVRKVRDTVKTGLSLLGIEAPERM